MDIKTATPAEIDTLLAEIYEAAAPLHYNAQTYRRYAQDAAKDERFSPANPVLAARYQAQADEFRAAYEAKVAECGPYNVEFDARGGWTRAFIVPDGHVHRSMDCSTCYPTTQFGWLPQVSGLTEAEIVEQAGEGACTVCYPTAPVVAKGTRTLFHKSEIEKQAARDARSARSAEIAAKKAAKAIGPVRVFDYHAPERHANIGRGEVKVIPAHDVFETLDTVHAAKGWLTDASESWRPRSKRPEDVAAVAEALAVKFGTTAAEQVEAAKVRAAKRK